MMEKQNMGIFIGFSCEALRLHDLEDVPFQKTSLSPYNKVELIYLCIEMSEILKK